MLFEDPPRDLCFFVTAGLKGATVRTILFDVLGLFDGCQCLLFDPRYLTAPQAPGPVRLGAQRFDRSSLYR